MKLALLRPYYGPLQLYLYSDLPWGSTEKLISFNSPRTLDPLSLTTASNLRHPST